MVCMHPISWMNKWILTKLVQLYCWDMEKKKLIRFWWPGPHFQGHSKAKIVGKLLVCTLSPKWMNGFWPNFYILIVETSHGKELKRFWWLDPIFKVTLRLKLVENGLSAPCLLKEFMSRFQPDLHSYIFGTAIFLVTFTPFSRSN